MEELKVRYDIISKYCEEFGEVRTIVDENGITWYCAADILRVLEFNNQYSSNMSKTLKRYDIIPQRLNVINDVKYVTRSQVRVTYTQSRARQSQMMNFISRDDVFLLLTNSKMKRAKEFKQWLFAEVLPTMELTGAYILDEAKEEYNKDPEAFVEQYKQAEVKIKNLREIVEKQKKEHEDLEKSLQESYEENARLNSKLDRYDYLKESPSLKEKLDKVDEFIDELEQTIDEKNAAHHMLRQLGYFHPETVTQFSKPLIKMN